MDTKHVSNMMKAAHLTFKNHGNPYTLSYQIEVSGKSVQLVLCFWLWKSSLDCTCILAKLDESCQGH